MTVARYEGWDELIRQDEACVLKGRSLLGIGVVTLSLLGIVTGGSLSVAEGIYGPISIWARLVPLFMVGLPQILAALAILSAGVGLWGGVIDAGDLDQLTRRLTRRKRAISVGWFLLVFAIAGFIVFTALPIVFSLVVVLLSSVTLD